MSLIIGNLDRQITIERATTSQDGAGQHIETWATLRTEYAEINPKRSAERHRDFQEVDRLTTVFRIRYFSGLLATDRISYDSQIYDIHGAEEKGHRKQEYIDITTVRTVQGAGR